MHVVHIGQRVHVDVHPGLVAVWRTVTVGQCQTVHASEGVGSTVGVLLAQAVCVDPVSLILKLATALRALT